MHGELQFGPALLRLGAQVQHQLRMSHSGGVGKRDAADSELDIAADEFHHPPRGLLAFERTTECSGQRAGHGDASSLELARDFTESFE